jgi:putative ABC transport system ATP-binding protein
MNDVSEAPLIELRGIEKAYRLGEVSVDVLRGVDLEVATGEYVAITGRSGSGKSTLMNILGCLDQPSAGTYQLAGREVQTLSDDQLSDLRGRTVGFVFQSFHLLKNLTVLQNAELPMEYQGVAPAPRRDKARALLERVGLGHRLTHRPNQLSGGERQRVALARSLANDPSLLLADEPTGNLDTKAREAMLALFEELHRETGITLVVVTHDPSIAERTPRVVHISDGRIA